MEGITFIENFVDNPDKLFHHFVETVEWDDRMAARKTASYGRAYNYSQIHYPFKDFLPELEIINSRIAETIGFRPNNCLINFYLDGKSKMGYHSDQTDILEAATGIVIISLGETRILRFKNILNPETIVSYDLPAGSLIYMTQEVQSIWRHAIPRSDTENGRISLTFRRMK